MSSVLVGAAGGPAGMAVGAGVELMTALAQAAASPAAQKVALAWLEKWLGVTQDKLDAAIAAQGPVGDPHP